MADGSERVSLEIDGKTVIDGAAMSDVRAALDVIRGARPGKGLAPDADFEAAASRPVRIAAELLTAFVERIERLEEAKADIAADIAAVYAEAKAQGYDAPTIRRTVKARRIDPKDRAEAQAMLDLYLHAVGEAGGRE